VTATQGEKSVKEIVHRKIKSLSSFTYDFLSSMDTKRQRRLPIPLQWGTGLLSYQKDAKASLNYHQIAP